MKQIIDWSGLILMLLETAGKGPSQTICTDECADTLADANENVKCQPRLI